MRSNELQVVPRHVQLFVAPSSALTSDAHGQSFGLYRLWRFLDWQRCCAAHVRIFPRLGDVDAVRISLDMQVYHR
jgi:hypothetical protein